MAGNRAGNEQGSESYGKGKYWVEGMEEGKKVGKRKNRYINYNDYK
jgi:hypothetical protein